MSETKAKPTPVVKAGSKPYMVLKGRYSQRMSDGSKRLCGPGEQVMVHPDTAKNFPDILQSAEDREAQLAKAKALLAEEEAKAKKEAEEAAKVAAEAAKKPA